MKAYEMERGRVSAHRGLGCINRLRCASGGIACQKLWGDSGLSASFWLRPDGHTVTKMSSSSKRTGTNPDMLLASCMSQWCVRDMSVLSPCLHACRPFKLSVWIYEGVCVGSYKYPQTVDLIEIRCGMKRNSLPTQQLLIDYLTNHVPHS